MTGWRCGVWEGVCLGGFCGLGLGLQGIIGSIPGNLGFHSRESWVCLNKLAIFYRFRQNWIVRKSCWELALHPFTVSTEFDGVKKSLLGTFPTSIFGLDSIRWCAKACLAQTLHPISVLTESDGAKKACLAQTLHPITSSAISDGAPAKKCSNSLHPSTLSAKSDGVSAKNAQIRYILFSIPENSMVNFH